MRHRRIFLLPPLALLSWMMLCGGFSCHGDVDPGPTPSGTINGLPTGFITAPATLTLDGGSLIPPGSLSIVGLTWDWGVGSVDSSTPTETVTHTYVAPGVYTITLLVEYDDGTVGILTTTVTVALITTVDSAGDVGAFSSLSVVGGRPAISYGDQANFDLKFAINGATDGSGAWTLTTVDNAGTVGWWNSLAVVGGLAAISYYDATNGNLKFVISP